MLFSFLAQCPERWNRAHLVMSDSECSHPNVAILIKEKSSPAIPSVRLSDDQSPSFLPIEGPPIKVRTPISLTRDWL